jgi:hypothetical protein
LELLKEPYKNNYEAAIGHFKFMLNHNILDITDGSAGQNQDWMIGALDTSDSKPEWLPPDEWKKLSKDEKDKRNAARAKAKARKDSSSNVGAVASKAQKRQAKKKRKIARLAKEVLKEAEVAAEEGAKRQRSTSGNPSGLAALSPADQFGRHASAVKLARMVAGQNDAESD